MGYQVIYESIPPKKRRKRNAAKLTAASFLLFHLLVNACWPRGAEVLRGMLWPVQWSDTLERAEVFAEELRYGEDFSCAAENFLRGLMVAD